MFNIRLTQRLDRLNKLVVRFFNKAVCHVICFINIFYGFKLQWHNRISLFVYKNKYMYLCSAVINSDKYSYNIRMLVNNKTTCTSKQ